MGRNWKLWNVQTGDARGDGIAQGRTSSRLGIEFGEVHHFRAMLIVDPQ